MKLPEFARYPLEFSINMVVLSSKFIPASTILTATVSLSTLNDTDVSTVLFRIDSSINLKLLFNQQHCSNLFYFFLFCPFITLLKMRFVKWRSAFFSTRKKTRPTCRHTYDLLLKRFTCVLYSART